MIEQQPILLGQLFPFQNPCNIRRIHFPPHPTLPSCAGPLGPPSSPPKASRAALVAPIPRVRMVAPSMACAGGSLAGLRDPPPDSAGRKGAVFAMAVNRWTPTRHDTSPFETGRLFSVNIGVTWGELDDTCLHYMAVGPPKQGI